MRTIAAFLLLAGLVSADIVHLKNGGKIEGRVTEEGTKYKIETATGGTIKIEKEEVARVEKKEFNPPAALLPKKTPPKLGSPYSHPFQAFKITLPPKWARGKQQGSSDASFYGPKDQFYIPRMDLRIEVSKKELHETVVTYKDAFRKAFKDVQFLFEEAWEARGRRGYQFCAVFKEGEPAITQQALYTFTMQDDRKYILSFNCTAAWFDKYYSSLDASMKSLRIYPAPKADKAEREKFLEAYNRGATAFQEGKMAEALAGFEEAAKLLPQFPDIHANIGAVHMRLNRWPDAEVAYGRAIEIDPEDAGSHYNLGACHLRQSKYDLAIVSLKKSTELEPASEPTLTNLGVAYLAKDLAEPARETLEKAVQTDPESLPAHYNLGIAFEKLNRKKDAERQFKDALSLDPAHDGAKKGLERLKGMK